MLRSTIRVGLVGVGLWGCASGPKDPETPSPAGETAPPPASTPAPEASAAPAPASEGNLYGTEIEPPTGGLGISGMGSESGATPKRIRSDAVIVKGSLPAETIRAEVRKNFGALRKCYEDGLSRNPKLEGTVLTRFVVERNGSVLRVGTSDSSIPDAEVATCVGAVFQTLKFPEPEGGLVFVSYPIRFSPE